MLVSTCGIERSDTGAAGARDPGDFKQWRLPRRLREISGLALTPDERLLAVTDEEGIVYELDYQGGRVVKSFAVGEPLVRADFEGIAVLQDQVWLMTSDGRLLAAAEGADGRSVGYRSFDTGHGAYCELEGLAQDRTAGTLLLACKETRSGKDQLMIFEWLATAAGIEYVGEAGLPEAAIAAKLDGKRINPSGVAVDPASGERVLIAARQAALVRLTADGVLSEAIILKKKGRHMQAEGIEMTRDGRMLIADEGGDGRARLAVYATVLPGTDDNE